MTTYNHTAITTGAAANASTFNSPLGQLDAAIGDLTTLTTTATGNLVAAINELEALTDDIGNVANLNTTNKSQIVGAINEIWNERHQATQTVASAGTIVLSDRGAVYRVTGATQINTITPLSADETMSIYLIALGAWTLGTSGNIAQTYSPSLNEVVGLVYDSVADLWYRVQGG